MGGDDIGKLREQHRVLKEQMPHAWNAFFAGFSCLRPVQLSAMPYVLAGKSALVMAPTAGGKTEAVAAPLCQRMAQQQWQGLSVLLIMPTRALVNDVYSRLALPCGQMGIRVGRKTADHSLPEQSADNILITTPESTESLLSFRKSTLANIRAVVLDEIHLLDGSPRGDQLRLVLKRLSAYRQYVGGIGFADLQRVAMSATVADPERLAAAFLGPGCVIVSVKGQRSLQARVLLADGTDQTRAAAAIDAIDRFTDVRKVLVFVNSRKQVDAGTGYFRHGRFAKVPVYGHHGSLSKSERERVEERFKHEPQAICVATMTLEVGIDIGDIDLVICMDPPFSVSSFLQRIGRGCRRLKGLTRVLCVARDRAGTLMFDALVRQATLGVPSSPTPPFRRSVLVQQVLAYLQQVDKHRRITAQFLKVLAAEATPAIAADSVEQVLAGMVRTGLLDRRGDVYQPASAGWDFIQSDRIYANIKPNPLEIALVDVESGNVVATIAGVSQNSEGIRVAGRSYHILPGSSAHELRVRSGGDHVGSPSYRARSLPYAFDIGAALASCLQLRTSELVAISIGNSVVAFTWLGRLLNAVLVSGLCRCGRASREGSFHITMENTSLAEVLTLIRNAVTNVLEQNPLGSMRPERMVDLGPHFELLPPDQQKLAREDWLPAEYLNNWVLRITGARDVAADSELGRDLLQLT